MAENKKSFVLYSDFKEVFEALSDGDAGQLIKHIFAYVNDENPETLNPLVKLSFIPIKLQLKRDLSKYEEKREQWSEAGKKSAEAKRLKKLTDVNESSTDSTNVKTVTTDSTVNDNVNVNVNVNVNDNDNDNDNVILLEKETKYNFRAELIKYGFFPELVNEWLQVRKAKKAVNTKTAFNAFIKEIELKRNCNTNLNDLLKICIEKSWSGFKWAWLENLNTNQTLKNNATNRNQTTEESLRAFIED